MTPNYLTTCQKTIESIETETKAEGNYFTKNHELVYILRGEAIFSYGYKNTGKTGETGEGNMIFLPMGSHVNYSIPKDSQLIIFHINNERLLCECCKKEDRNRKKKVEKGHSVTLKASTIIKTYMNTLNLNLSGENDYTRYFNVKIHELLLLIDDSYTKDELAVFFGETLYKETAFTSYVLHNYHLYNTVIEFAKAMGYTVSGFEKRFKKAFGISPYKWMKEQKAKRIYQEVCFGKYNFKQIADKYNFASTSTFNDFYKLTFGETPGKARRKAEER